MKFRSLDVQAFNRFRAPFSVPLDGQGLVLVEGINLDGGDALNSNAAGKSLAIVETLLWCLFGKMVRYGDKAIGAEATHPQNGADVAVQVEMQGRDFWIERTRTSKGKPTFGISLGSGEPFPVSRDPNKRSDDVAAFLGFGYKAFRYAVVVQGEDSLAADGFAAQMEVLESILRMDELSSAADLGRQQAVSLDRACAAARATADAAGRAYQQAQQLMDDLENPMADEADARMVEKLEAAIKAGQVAATLVTKLAGVVADTRKTIDFKRKTALEAGASITPWVQEKARQEKSLEKLVCPTCGRPYGTPAEAEKAKTKAEKKVKDLEKLIRDAYDVKEVADREAAQAGVRLHAQEQELRTTQREADAVPGLQEQVDRVRAAVKERQRQRRTMELNLEQIREEFNTATREATRLDGDRQRKMFWVTGYGRDGLQADIFAAALPVLNHAAARYSQVLTNGLTTVTFNTLRASTREDLVRIEGASAQTYDGLSAGEKQRVNLIIALSLRTLARWRLPVPINLSVYDECFDKMDPAGLTKVVGLLREDVEQAGGTTFVVTHNPALKALFPGARVLTVTRKDGQAEVRYAA